MKKTTLCLFVIVLLVLSLTACQSENHGAPKEPSAHITLQEEIPVPPDSSPALSPMFGACHQEKEVWWRQNKL